MPEPFKNSFNLDLIKAMAFQFQKHSDVFQPDAFIQTAAKNLEDLELKERSTQIMEAMERHLPMEFEKAAKVILSSLNPTSNDELFGVGISEAGIAGWAIMPITHYVGLQGQNHFEISMQILKEATKCFTSEFAIRFFLIDSPEKTLRTLKAWTSDPNRHVRRLVSEGCRPRLPWAMQLPAFIKNPEPVIELLELLKDDPEEYVRRSVANNLNDIAKDHPNRVAEIAEAWSQNATKNRQKLIRHACRTLIKNGHKKTLEILGYHEPKLEKVEIQLKNDAVNFGDKFQFSLNLKSGSNQDQELMIDYVIHHQKANGTTSPKVFKWQNKTLKARQQLISNKKHPFKKVTTRKYYPGLHQLEVMINGNSVGIKEFKLLMP